MDAGFRACSRSVNARWPADQRLTTAVSTPCFLGPDLLRPRARLSAHESVDRSD